MKRIALALGATVLGLAITATSAHAFCGFYVSGSGTKMFADATSVVLMREGTRTILSMQNDYRGPLEDFAMVVPVPVVLKEEEVKTLPRGVIERVDSLGSPRLVEYWEQNPCPEPQPVLAMEPMSKMSMKPKAARGRADSDEAEPVVKIEAQFTVGEYNILILSATEAAGLETWLKQNKYTIPDGAEPLLRPYVEAGSKFFVAKVDPKKVAMGPDGRATLSPLRFHYDSEEFSLPIRLGMANSSGKQDLIVSIISPDKRYEVANYKNVVIPTNFDVKPTVKERFAEFYAALFDKTLEANPGAVVTEYAWTAQPTPRFRGGRGGRGGMGGKCDPCPQNEQGVLMIPMDSDMITLGGDVLGATPGGARISQGGYVLTRLHARYGKSDMKDDLRFKEAKPITGGREVWSRSGLEYGAQPAAQNNFQARYAIRYWWTGPIRCANPQRGVWGGPPSGGGTNVIAASKAAYAPRGKFQLASAIKRDLWEIGFKKATAAPAAPKTPAPAGTKTMFFGGGALGGLLLIGLVALVARKRKP